MFRAYAIQFHEMKQMFYGQASAEHNEFISQYIKAHVSLPGVTEDFSGCDDATTQDW